MVFRSIVVNVPDEAMVLKDGKVMIITERSYNEEKKYYNNRKLLIGQALDDDRTKMYPNTNYSKVYPEIFIRAKNGEYDLSQNSENDTQEKPKHRRGRRSAAEKVQGAVSAEIEAAAEEEETAEAGDNADTVVSEDTAVSSDDNESDQSSGARRRRGRRISAEKAVEESETTAEHDNGPEQVSASDTDDNMRIGSLGSGSTEYPTEYDPGVLECFENKHIENDYFVKFNCPEFTSLCPITSQPDFGTIYISYIPDKKLVESKSLKLYLYSFRNHGSFHENCVNTIMKDLIKLLKPKYIEVFGKFNPRGGISIDPYCNFGKPGTKWEQMAFDRLMRHDMYPENVDNR